VFASDSKGRGIKLGYHPAIKLVSTPLFATSAKKEILQVSEILRHVDKKYITHFKPKVEGFHGSKTIWEIVKGNETYWDALVDFLDSTQ